MIAIAKGEIRQGFAAKFQLMTTMIEAQGFRAKIFQLVD